MRKVEVKTYNGSPTILVNGKPLPPMMINIWTSSDNHTDCVLHEDYFRGLAQGGIKTFFVSCDTEWAKPNAFWIFEKQVKLLLKYVPDAYIFLRIGLHPSNEWIEQNPEECYTLNTGERPSAEIATETYHTVMPHHYSLASSKWREEAGRYLNDFMDKVDKMPESDRILSTFFVAGHTSEWYHNVFIDSEERYGDFSAAFRRAFSKFLKDKYKTEDNLRKQWRSSNVTFENPFIPDGKVRYYAKRFDREIAADGKEVDFADISKYLRGANIGHFLDIDNYQYVQDFFLAFDTSIAESQIYFAKLIKDRYQGNMLTGAFFGSYGWTDFFLIGTCVGVNRILDSGYMDFLAAPGDYRNRQPGGFTGQREMADSYRIRNKVFFIEEDTRTHLERSFFKKLFDYYDIEDSVNILKRDFGRNVCEDTYAWWLDQHYTSYYGGEGGRYRHEGIYNLFRRQQNIIRTFYENYNRSKHNEIALIFDEESTKVISNDSTHSLVSYFRDYEIARLGAGVDQYYHNDMSNPNMPDYKLYVFFNTLALSDQERDVIRAKLHKNKATALWIYAPGIINPDKEKKFDISHMNEMTGFNFVMKQGVFNPKYKISKNTNHPITQGLDTYKLFGYESSPYNNNIVMGTGQSLYFNSPLFFVEGDGVVDLAYYSDSGYPALSYQNIEGIDNIYLGAKILNHEILRNIAKFAGCHIFANSSDVVYASNSFVTIHASYTGRRTLTFPEKVSPYEVYERKYYGNATVQLKLDMHIGETKMFSLIGEI